MLHYNEFSAITSTQIDTYDNDGSIITFFGSAVNCAGQLWMRVSRFGRNHDIGPILGRLEGDRLADASAGASDEQGLSCEFPAQ